MAVAPPSHGVAPVPGGAVHLGITAGYQFTSKDADLLGDRSLDVRAADLPVFGVRAGVGLLSPLSVELTATMSPVWTRSGGYTGVALQAIAEVVGHLNIGPVAVDFAAGAGGSGLVAGELGTDIDLVLSAGIGARYVFLDGLMGLRLDFRALFSDAVTAPIAAHAVLGLGIDFFLTRPEWGEAEEVAPPTDRDGDGVRDERDECPEAAGLRALRGCPDEDGDAIPDAEDACPETVGELAFHGCPDTDADGIPDTIDACPTLHGAERFAGCPDRDDDGVPDGQDACPKLKGQAERRGCPTPSPEVLARFGRPLEAVEFASGSAELSADSGPALARLANVLQAHPDIRVEVQAHVHSRIKGKRAYELTEARARAVAARLIELGLDPRRVGAVGLGSERPIASNRSSNGRAMNERIEVHLAE